jgi:CDP-glucose 4,6-dehydratase
VELGARALEGVAISPPFWRGKKVFLTGHTGFKGSWLTLWLNTLGAETVGYSSGRPSDPCLFDAAHVDDGIVSLEGDVRDFAGLAAAVERHTPDVVIHMAAQSLVRRSFRDPLGTYETNVLGTANILEVARRAHDVRVVVNVTSDKCYDHRDGDPPHREDDPKGGRDPYSSSKACAELLTSAYRGLLLDHGGSERMSPAVASVRAGNVIGGGDWAEDRLVPDIMRAALERRPVAIRSPGAVRPWQHVLNPLAGYLLLIERLWNDDAYGAGWNFGPDDEDAKPVAWIVERLSELWPEGVTWERAGGDADRAEMRDLRLDSSKARVRLGWAPRWNLEQALRSTVAWYRAFEAGEDVREVALEQIRSYQTGRRGVTVGP